MKHYFVKTIVIVLAALFTTVDVCGQYTHQDTLRGSIGKGRSWWDVKYYAIAINVDITDKQIEGSNQLTFEVLDGGTGKIMQIDLQEPMEILSIEDTKNNNRPLAFKREGNVYWVDFGDKKFAASKSAKDLQVITIHFKGNPRIARNAPWDGGWVWATDEKGRPWITVACQGLGASVWYPCKDHQSDEPDNGASLSITAPGNLVAVGNGRLKEKKPAQGNAITWKWEVVNPINNYNIVPYIGSYVNWQEIYKGKAGNLDCSFWVLDYNLAEAKKHFGRDVKPMLACFEEWFGPYPFYKDSYKLVETPHLGMEHQSAVAYGNKYLNGYLGTDLSGTGWGIKWDFIIIHESGHEWFANNITARDIADMWVHEGFTNYSEVLFVECRYGKKAADEYCQGLRPIIQNDTPVIGAYGVNKEGSSDMYPKGANMLHTIRQVINDDKVFRKILQGLNREFYHRTVSTGEVEAYMIQQSGKDLSKIFDQYLRTTKIPVLEYRVRNKSVSFRWTQCVNGFNMAVKVSFGEKVRWLKPSTSWETVQLADWYDGKSFYPDKNFYIRVKEVSP